LISLFLSARITWKLSKVNDFNVTLREIDFLMKYCLAGLVAFFIFPPFVTVAQFDNVGSGRAIQFDGIDDYISINNNYSNLKLPFTVSAWIYLDPSSNLATPIFVANDNDPIYRGFWFFATPTSILIEFGDGAGASNPAFRRGKLANAGNLTGRWIHVCAVFKAPFDIGIFINGVDVGGTPSGGSSLAMSSSLPSDKPKIGYFLSNGVTYRNKSILDEIQLWNRALSEAEVRQNMCKRRLGNESGLIGYWNFDEVSGDTVFDSSPNKFNGQLIGNPSRVFSGAPIGDVSTYLYSTSWAGKTIALQGAEHKVSAKNVSGLIDGIQIYEVKNSPSQSSGLDASLANKPYFGIFACTKNPGGMFDVEYSFNGNTSCKSYSRSDNSKSVWGNSSNPLIGVFERSEIINVLGTRAIFELGPDKVLCDQLSLPISTGITDPQFTFQWSTGQTSSSIVVSQSGLYKVKVFSSCGMDTDSIRINFLEKPKAFSLGADQLVCVFNPVTLAPLSNPTGYSFLWQDGSKGTSYEAKDFGKYWVTVRNFCGQFTDSISFVKKNGGATFDLGPDKVLCDQLSFPLSTGITDPQFTFQWSTGQNSSSILTNQSGFYKVKVFGSCGVDKDSILISFLRKPVSISLGEDFEFCELNPFNLTLANAPLDVDYQWQDGSQKDNFEVKEFGIYWVTVKNLCGQVSDTIVFSKIKKKIDFVPNVITPNGDKDNEYFHIDDKLLGLVSLKVINRWGAEVFYSQAYDNKWNGSDLSNGVYFIDLYGPCIERAKSSLTIIR